MGIFNRRKGREPAPEDLDDAPAASGETEPVAEATAEREREPTYDRAGGPYDVTERPDREDLLDLGSVRLAGVPGMEIRLEVDNESQNVTSVTAVLGESALQVQAFAAPRREGIWSEVRTEIAASVTQQGGTVEQMDGPMGPELLAQLPTRAPDGRRGYSPTRFIGVDGPRWFLRGVLNGRAAVDPEAAEALLVVFRGSVVVRGDEAMAPRDLLPLSLPEQAADEVAPPAGEEVEHPGADPGSDPGDAPHPHADDLRPFERGPEITEVR